MARVGNEFFFVQSATIIDADTVRLNNLIRGRYGTPLEAHSIGDAIVIFYKQLIPFKEDNTLIIPQTIYLKSQPFGGGQAIPLDSISSVQFDYTGQGKTPFPVVNVATEDGTDAWVSGGDIELRWDFRNAGSVAGAGFSLSDEPAELDVPEGAFKITIKFGTAYRVVETTNASFTW